jgi:8-amino-7-oxononanoate synthase
MTCRINPAPEALRPLAPLPESLSWLEGSLQRLQSEGLMRPHRVRRGRQGRLVELDGRELVNFGANDYLGYAGDVRLTRSCSKGSCAEGFGSGASPLVSGHSQAHEALESALANLLQTEAAIVFPSGFAANAATIPALVGEGDLIVSDERNHASIIDGCRLTRARLLVYPHRDLRTLVSQVEAALPARRLLIVTDSLFSMDGTVAPLADLCDIADRFGGMLMVDEAHATGVFGDRGSGLLEATGCAARVSIRVGTLSKALGTA